MHADDDEPAAGYAGFVTQLTYVRAAPANLDAQAGDRTANRKEADRGSVPPGVHRTACGGVRHRRPGPGRAGPVQEVFDRLVGLRPEHVVVDLSQCRHLDAAAVGLLLDVHRHLARHGGVLTLRDPSPRALRVLSAARVSRVLPMVTTPRALPVDGGLVPSVVHRQPAPPRVPEHSR